MRNLVRWIIPSLACAAVLAAGANLFLRVSGKVEITIRTVARPAAPPGRATDNTR